MLSAVSEVTMNIDGVQFMAKFSAFGKIPRMVTRSRKMRRLSSFHFNVNQLFNTDGNKFFEHENMKKLLKVGKFENLIMA